MSSASHNHPSGTFVAARCSLAGKEGPGTLENDGSMLSERTREREQLGPAWAAFASLVLLFPERRESLGKRREREQAREVLLQSG